MKVSWNDSHDLLQFDKLSVNQTFRIVGGRGAVYAKVLVNPKSHSAKHMMYEVATGHVFEPTHSTVELVDVDVHVNTKKPILY